ncbi:MAG TPA: polysaccharide lyase 6 family protein [Pilimelia sp.]|nr:polysaccharide lyase 6 family protein [Pilimelia sp.]
MLLPAVALVAGLGTPAHATSRLVAVSSVAELRTAVANAQPGDVISLADGEYPADTVIELSRSGTADAPITLTAENTGAAQISGAAGLKLRGAYLVIRGIRFTQATTLSLPTTSHHVQLTRNVFQLRDPAKDYVIVSGDDVQVDYNTFQNKQTVGVFLAISGPGTAGMAQRTWVHHNHFINHSYSGSNGGESIRLGTSARQHSSAYAKIEKNMFSAADGDREAISVKSADNLIRYNRIDNSFGTITLRHGNRNRVEGNLLIGGATGIRIYGNDHTVVNNVVQSSSGTAVSIAGGDLRDDTDSSTRHDAADNVLLAFNTLAYNASNMIRLGDHNQPYAPQQITIVNNVVRGSTATMGTAARVEGPVTATWRGNMLYGATAGGTPASGYTVADPEMVLDPTGIYRLTADSPAVGAAVGSYDEISRDMDGQARPALRSIGADEVVTAPVTHKLVTETAVGPAATEAAPAPHKTVKAPAPRKVVKAPAPRKAGSAARPRR